MMVAAAPGSEAAAVSAAAADRTRPEWPAAGGSPCAQPKPTRTGGPSSAKPPLDPQEPAQKSAEFQRFGPGVAYYGYRWYDPATGRWPSRDPIEERGGINLYGFVGNDSVYRIDFLGLTSNQSNGCKGSWGNGGLTVHPSIDWGNVWFEIGSGNLSWYGIGIFKVCSTLIVNMTADVKCRDCCPLKSNIYKFRVPTGLKVCMEFELPWLMVITGAGLAGAPIPGTRVMLVIGAAAFATRVTQRLQESFWGNQDVINKVIDVRNKALEDDDIPNMLCGGEVSSIQDFY